MATGDEAFWNLVRTNPGFARFVQWLAARSPTRQQLPGTLPAADSTYLAFLRGVGLQQSEAISAMQRNLSAIQQRFSLARSDVERQGVEAREDIDRAHLARGAYRSGTRLEDVARQRAVESRSLARLRAEESSAIAGQQTDLERRLADLARQRAEQDAELVERHERRQAEQRLQDLQRNLISGGAGGGGSVFFTGGTPAPAAPPDDRWARLLSATPDQLRALSGQPRTLAGYRVSGGHYTGRPASTTKPSGLR